MANIDPERFKEEPETTDPQLLALQNNVVGVTNPDTVRKAREIVKVSYNALVSTLTIVGSGPKAKTGEITAADILRSNAANMLEATLKGVGVTDAVSMSVAHSLRQITITPSRETLRE